MYPVHFHIMYPYNPIYESEVHTNVLQNPEVVTGKILGTVYDYAGLFFNVKLLLQKVFLLLSNRLANFVMQYIFSYNEFSYIYEKNISVKSCNHFCAQKTCLH